MMVVRNGLTAYEAAVQCAKLGKTAAEGLRDGVYSGDVEWGWDTWTTLHEVETRWVHFHKGLRSKLTDTVREAGFEIVRN